MNSNWTQTEIEFLEKNYELMPGKEIAAALGRSYGSVKTKAGKLGLRRNRFQWNEEKIALLKKMYPITGSTKVAEMLGCTLHCLYNKAYDLKLRKNAEFLSSEASGRIQKYSEKGKAGRFKKGLIPWNKGKHTPSVGRMKETQFKPGEMPFNYQPVGTILTDSYGYLKVKISDPNKWKFLHRYLWEQEHGRIPKGMIVVFKDQNPNNCVLENLEMISRGENMKRNTIHNLPPELKKIKRTLGDLQRVINKKEKEMNNSNGKEK